MTSFRHSLSPVAPFVLAAAGAFFPAPEALAQQLPADSAATLRVAAARAVLALEKGRDVEDLMKDDAYRVALDAHEVLRVTGDGPVDALRAKYPDFPRFLRVFLSDRAWMEAYLDAGNVPAGNPYGLETLYRIWKAEGASQDFSQYDQLSAAIASSFGAGDGAAGLREGLDRKPFGIDPVWRFRFFRDRWKVGRLNPMFGALKSWELLFVVGKDWDDASYAWLNDNINVPLARYTDAYRAVTYRGESDFGDSIQGPLFYAPWRDLMPMAESVKIHGGVCGSLSTFGATAAAAHGIPAYTCGQPGHCAYAVRLARGKWTGGFGGPDGGFHTFIWAGNIHYMETMEKVFGDDAGLNLALAHAARARLLFSVGDAAGAEKATARALEISPEHLDLRREHLALLADSGRLSPSDWRRYAEDLLTVFGDNSDPAIALTRTFDSKFLKNAGDAEKLAWYAKIQAAAARATPSWQWANQYESEVLDPEFKSLSTDASREEFLRLALDTHLHKGEGSLFGKVLEWGLANFLKQGDGDAFGRAFAAASAGGNGPVDERKLAAAYDKAIAAACEARSIPAFLTLGRAAARFARKSDVIKYDKPPGRLVSPEGALRLSSQAWCSAVDFLNVLNETGGLVHTKDERNPFVIVELPKPIALSGVLVVKNPGNEYRMKKMRVSRSVDGATWFPVAVTQAMPSQWRIDTPDGEPARWIKVEALNDAPQFMHFRNILVFAGE